MGKYRKIPSGTIFGKLTVIDIHHKEKHIKKDGIIENKEFYKCVCSCGKEKIVKKEYLVWGKVKSCGCIQNRDRFKEIRRNKLYGNRLAKIWAGMKERCTNQKNPAYKLYGGRGIHLCDQWYDSNNFYTWALENGYSDELTIDRIDNDGDYRPDNCRWVTMKEQSRNRSTNRLIKFNGEILCLIDWAKKLGIKRTTLSMRLDKYGWDVKKAFCTPVRVKEV